MRLYWHVYEGIRNQRHKHLWKDETSMTWMFMNEWDFNDMNIYEWMRLQCQEYL